jgi:transposase
MYRVDMYYTIKTLLSQNKSQRKIAKELGIHRSTVKRLSNHIKEGKLEPPLQQRSKKLLPYHDIIKEYFDDELSGKLIHQKLLQEYKLKISYVSVCRYINVFKDKEVFVPVNTPPGEEAQVDFGYLGYFEKNGRWIKTWCFCMVLSNSRYSFYKRVSNQSVKTFLLCHREAFEYFGGVPAVIKIDNLKAGVNTPDFYEPSIQHQYAAFLKHYNSSPITARVRRPQDKGKVESGVKYAKSNFIKGLTHRDYNRLETDLAWWNYHVANKRIHGTTRKVPAEVFHQVEKMSLQPLPSQPYEIMDIQHRKVNRMGHIMYRYNYYSVPSKFVGETLRVESNDKLLRMYNGTVMIATHSLSQDKGQYITREEHLPQEKRRKPREYYIEHIEQIGPGAMQFVTALEEKLPRHWHDMARGIIKLSERYEKSIVNQACQRAFDYGVLRYQHVKNICKNQAYNIPDNHRPINADLGGFKHELSFYDKIV